MDMSGTGVFVPISDLNGIVDYSQFSTHFKLVPGEIPDFDWRKQQVELKLRSIHDKLDEIGKHQSYCKKKVYNALGKIMSYQSRFAVFRQEPSEKFTKELLSRVAANSDPDESTSCVSENSPEIVSDLLDTLIQTVCKVSKTGLDVGEDQRDMGLGDFAVNTQTEKDSMSEPSEPS